MIHRPALTFALSMAILVISTIVLYRTPRLARALEHVAHADTRHESAPPDGLPRPGEPQSGSGSTRIPQSPSEARPATNTQASAARAKPRAIGLRETSATLTARTPARSYTRAQANESLTQVAARVYGAPEFADELWRANRDRLAHPDQVLKPGQMLRTPRL